MPISMSSASLPALVHALNSLSHILDKAQAHAEAHKIDPLVLTQFRLYPDMFPFSRQVQIACDGPKNGVARLAGMEAPKFDDTETTLMELKFRVQKTVDFLKTVPAASVDGTEDKEITFPAGGGNTRTMKGEDYLRYWLLPNCYFHVTTAYAILRHNGVPLGKVDYLLGRHV